MIGKNGCYVDPTHDKRGCTIKPPKCTYGPHNRSNGCYRDRKYKYNPSVMEIVNNEREMGRE